MFSKKLMLSMLLAFSSFISCFDQVVQPKLWSILICTLDERKEVFERLYHKVQDQINENNLADKVDITFFRDDREVSVGYKRNALIRYCTSEYVCFLDDDDDVHDQYVAMIYEKLLKKPDCVSLVGIITTRGQNPELFIHTIRFGGKYCTEQGVHYRPPNHLNPMKRSIAQKFLFPEINFCEDKCWATQVYRSGLLRYEEEINIPYYFYHYDGKYHGTSPAQKKPRVSIITSLYKGDEFIAGFLADMVRQTIFSECELIIVNANSPGNEEPIIKEYCACYSNIVYERLEKDPGIYGTWNYALKKARAELIANANLDDRRNPCSLEEQALALENDPTVDVVYSDFLLTCVPHETFERNSALYVVQTDEFMPHLMRKCLPGAQPMWRKSLHTRFGFFDEHFKIAGDYEFWNRVVSNGARFKKIPGLSGLYYHNPQGLSTDVTQSERLNYENMIITSLYADLWQIPGTTP